MKSQFHNLKGNEHTGTEVCLYIIDKLVSGYTSDTWIKKLIDDKNNRTLEPQKRHKRHL